MYYGRVSAVCEFKICPFCKEQIRKEAVKCRFCGEWLDEHFRPKLEPHQQRDNPPPALIESLEEATSLPGNAIATTAKEESPTPKPPKKGVANKMRSRGKPPLTRKQIVILIIAAVVILFYFFAAYSSRPAAELLPARLIKALIVTAWRICLTPGGIICILVLSGLFYRFRIPPDRGIVDDGYELLERALRLEMKGQILEALKAYEYVAARYSHTTAGQDAQKSIESLRALR